jgi:prepilin-type N-terminal cleavage/methylation domain-containing protein
VKAKARIRGMTLIELMVVLAIFTIVMTIIYSMFITGRRTQRAQEEVAMVVGEAKAAVELLERELRMVGVYKKDVANKPCDLDESLNKVVLLAANTTALEFEGDLQLDGTLERVRYWWEPTTKILYRKAMSISSRDDSQSGGLSCSSSISIKSETLAPTQPVAFFVNSLSIEYYRSDGTKVASPNFTPTNNDDTIDITRVIVRIQTRGKMPLTAAGEPPLREFTLDMTIPNLGTKGGAEITPPDAPTDFVAWDPGVCGRIEMTWSPSGSTDLEGYRLYYMRTDAPAWSTVDIPKTYTAWQLTGLQNGASYKLMLAAYDYYGNLSNTTDVLTVGPLQDATEPTVPTGLAAAVNSIANSITLSWDDVPDIGKDKDGNTKTTDVFGQPYKVRYNLWYESADLGISNQVLSGNMNAASYVHINAQKCAYYTYRVQSLDACWNVSANSSDVQARVETTKDPGPPGAINPGRGGFTGAGKGKQTYRIYITGSNANATDAPAFKTTVVVYNQGQTDCSFHSGDPKGNELEPSPMVWSTSPEEAGAGGSFSGHWDEATKDYYCFSAYTVDKCGRDSEFLNASYKISGACKDEPAFSNGTGLEDCIVDATARVCAVLGNGVSDYGAADGFAGITLWWNRKGHDSCEAYPCDADGTNCIENMATDFYPDQGIGGYIIKRSLSSAPKDFPPPEDHEFRTGPLTPYHYQDTKAVANTVCSYDGLTERCQYHYALVPVDCELNPATNEEPHYTELLKAPDGTFPAYFSPGRFDLETDTDTYPIRIEGKKRDKVSFWIRNTAAASMSITRMQISWNEENWNLTEDSEGHRAYLRKIEIYNGSSTITFWQAGSPSDIKPSGSIFNGTDVAFINSTVLGVSPEFISRGVVRLHFTDPQGRPLDMTSSNLGANAEIYMSIYYVNHSSTYAGSNECIPYGPFTVKVPSGPTIRDVKQTHNPGFDFAVDTATTTPPEGNFRGDSLLLEAYQDVLVEATIKPFKKDAPVPECGVRLWYYLTDLYNTTAPVPTDDTGAENVQSPTNYTGSIDLCNTDSGEACAESSCIYNGVIEVLPADGSPHKPGKRMFYYLVATDEKGNFGLAPEQPPEEDAPYSTFSYDTKNRYYYLRAGDITNTASDEIVINYLWTTAAQDCTDSSPEDRRSDGTTSAVLVEGTDPSGNPVSDNNLKTTTAPYGGGCRDCWPCESGYSDALSTSKQFDLNKEITITITHSKEGFTTRSCTWTNGGSGTNFSSADTECRGE